MSGRIRLQVALSVWLLATAFAAGESGALECNSLETAAAPPCAHLPQETSKWYSAALAFEQRGARKFARDTYSRVVASAGWPIELFLAHTILGS